MNVCGKSIFFRSLLFSGAFHDILPEFPRWEIWPRRSHLLFSVQSLEKLPEGHVWREGMSTYVHDTQKCFVSYITLEMCFFVLFFFYCHESIFIHMHKAVLVLISSYSGISRFLDLGFSFHWYFVFHKCGGYYMIRRFSSELTSSW